MQSSRIHLFDSYQEFVIIAHIHFVILDPAIIEMHMMVWLNKDLKCLNPSKVPSHQNDWKALIPTSPLFDSDFDNEANGREDEEEDLEELQGESDQEDD